MLKIDEACAATLELESAGLMREPWGTSLAGPQEMRRRELWRSADGRIATGVWECDAGRFETHFDGVGEFIRVISGTMTCSGDDAETTTLVPGDCMTFPPGWRGVWDIAGPLPLRKVFCGFEAS
jgi:uncharacterized cupin superfamily protein